MSMVKNEIGPKAFHAYKALIDTGPNIYRHKPKYLMHATILKGTCVYAIP